MHAPATMRLCNNAVLAVLLAGAALTLPAQQARHPTQASAQAAQAQAPSLTEDRDPVRSPDAEAPAPRAGPLRKQGEGYVLHTDVEEVVLNCTVLEGNAAGPGPEEGRLPGLRGRRQADPHQLSAHRPAGLDCPGGRQLRLHVPQAALGEQERAGPDPGLEPPGRGLCGELLRRGLYRPGFHLGREQAARRAVAHRIRAAARRSTMPWWPRRTSWWPTPSAPSRF